MGKIHDALKRADKEAQIRREKTQVVNAEPATGTGSITPIRKDTPREEEVVAEEQPELSYQKADTVKASPVTALPKRALTAAPKGTGFSFLNIFKSNDEDVEQATIRSLFVLEDPRSPVAEQFRALRTRILTFAREKNLKILLVTSCLAAEGKSTVASNLAISIARGINEYALLVDCDLRRPTIHKLFRLNNGTGLSNYLSDNMPLSQILSKTGIEKLSVLPAGIPPDNPTELLSSHKMADLLTELKKQYEDRYIIIDSSPAHQTPETIVISKHVDGIILVVKSGATSRDIIKDTVASLGQEKIIGVVFNMSSERANSHYYNYNYYSKQHS